MKKMLFVFVISTFIMASNCFAAEKKNSPKREIKKIDYCTDVSDVWKDATREQIVYMGATRFLKITEAKFIRNFGMMEMTFKVKNCSNFQIKDMHFEFNYLAPSGTVVDTGEETAYEIIEPGEIKTLRLKELVHSQAKRIHYKIQESKFVWEESKPYLDW